MLLALGLYLYDSAMLLQPNELLLVQARKGRWTPAFGSNSWKLSGKEPYLPNPFSPGRQLLHLSWRFEDGIQGPLSEGGTSIPTIDAWPRVYACALLFLIFAALPFCLFFYPVTAVTLIVVLAIYTHCIAALLSVYLQRQKIGLSSKDFWKLAFECITCPPFCINLVRKLSLRAPLHLTLSDAAAALFSDRDLDNLRRQVLQRVKEQIDIEPEGTDRMARLQEVARILLVQEAL